MSEMLAKPVHIEGTPSSTPEISRIDYDLHTLRVTLHFSEISHAYLTFKDISGFRVLREGDLIELWGSLQPEDWLWEISSGGWKSLESQRPGFISGHISEIKEFLVGGEVDCLSVLCSSTPEFTAVAP